MRGVEGAPVCVNASRRDEALEPQAAEMVFDADHGRFVVRLGSQMIRGRGNAAATKSAAVRWVTPFAAVGGRWRHLASVRSGMFQSVPIVPLFTPAGNEGVL